MNHLKIKNLTFLVLMFIWVHQAVGQKSAMPTYDTLFTSSLQDGLENGLVHMDDSIFQSLRILKIFYSDTSHWREEDRVLRQAIQNLIFQVENVPIDTSLAVLKSYPFGEVIMDTLEIQSPIDSLGFRSDRILAPDSVEVIPADSLLRIEALGMVEPYDSLHLAGTDTLTTPVSDQIIPMDTTGIQVAPDLKVVPVFQYVEMEDSVQKAMIDLIRYMESRPDIYWLINAAGDSTRILSAGDRYSIKRFWLKNSVLDSLGLWVETLDNGRLRFLVDDGVYFTRITRGDYRKKFLFPEEAVDTRLKEVQLIEIETNPWDVNGIGEILLSQVYLSNWAKGGENALSGLFKGNLNAIYSREKLKWENRYRFKYGVVRLKEEGVRKGEDEWELNTSIGFKQSNTWYYSFGFNLKSQFTPGYKYPDDSTRVSGFLSPGYLYSSAGLEYKPSKESSMLVSPLTYRSTFVIDTSRIEHTKFGIPADRKAKNEIGIFIKGNYTFDFNEDLSLENRLQFFTNYNGFNKVDFDYEANFKARLGPFITFNFNVHFIYNSDVTFPIYDDTGTVIDRKPRLQFKEWMAFGLSYKF